MPIGVPKAGPSPIVPKAASSVVPKAVPAHVVPKAAPATAAPKAAPTPVEPKAAPTPVLPKAAPATVVPTAEARACPPTPSDEKDPKKPREKTELETLLGRMVKIRARYLTVCTKTTSLKELVQKDDQWKWCLSACTSLFQVEVKLTNKIRDEGLAKFLHSDLGMLKKTLSEKVLSVQVNNFLLMDPDVSFMEKEHASLTRMHTVRQPKPETPKPKGKARKGKKQGAEDNDHEA